MAEIVRMGVVGAGSIAVRGIMPHLAMEDVHDRVRMTAVCDPAPGRAAAASERFDIPNHFETYEELLASGTVDAVSIASPIGLHFDQGMQAVEAGVHMHFNKTMTTTKAEADTLMAAAEAKGVKIVASPGEMIRPVHQEIKRMIERGDLGTLTWAICGSAFSTYHEQERVRHGDDPLSNINPAWYFRKPGGGPLYDMTVYGLHATTGILGPVKRVTAMSGVRIHEREFRGEMLPTDMDDSTLIVVDFGDNLFGFVYGVAAGAPRADGRITLFGTKGTISGPMFNGEMIDYPGRDEDTKHGGYNLNGSLPHVVGPHQEQEEAHVYEDIMQLVDLLLYDKPTLSTPEHARHVIEVFDKAYLSAETGTVQEVVSTF